jgi:predicted DNA binding protein
MHNSLLATIEYNHFCICSDVPERHPDTSITYLAELEEDKKDIAHLFNVSGGDIDQYLESIRSHQTTTDLKVLRRQKNSADIIAVTKNDVSTKYALKRSGCAFLSNPIYEQGIERIHLFAPDFESLKGFLDSLRNSYNVKVTSKHYLKKNEKIRPQRLIESGFLDFVNAAGKLTRRQVQALKLASNMNYYDIPKKTSLEKIGERMGITEAAASELLRKAERKLLPTIAKIIQLKN